MTVCGCVYVCLEKEVVSSMLGGWEVLRGRNKRSLLTTSKMVSSTSVVLALSLCQRVHGCKRQHPSSCTCVPLCQCAPKPVSLVSSSVESSTLECSQQVTLTLISLEIHFFYSRLLFLSPLLLFSCTFFSRSFRH